MICSAWPALHAGAGVRAEGFMAGALLVMLACAAYWPSLGGAFLWDDDQMVQFNPLLNDLSGLLQVWFNPPDELPDYFPLTYSVFWLEKWWWNDWAGGYRLVNVLLHGLSVWQFWRLLRTLRLPGAWVAALIFGLHPVNAESVAWIAELKNLLALILLLPALEAYVRHEQTGEVRPYRWSLAWYGLALLAKPSVVGLPLVIWLYLFWARGTLPSRRDLGKLAPFLAAGLAFGLVTIHFQHQHAIGDEVVPLGGPLSRTAGAGLAVWFYLGKALWPIDLATIYPRWDADPARWWQLGLAALVPAVAALCWWRRDGWGRHVGFGLGTFLVLVAPALGFIRMAYMRHSLVADHFQHLALPAVVALVVCGGAALWPRDGRKALAGALLVACAGLGLFAATWQRAAVHHDEEALWSDTLRRNPGSWQAYSRLGNRRLNDGQPDAALRLFSEGLRAPTINGELQHNLGSMLSRHGRHQEALELFRISVAHRPRFPLHHRALITTLIALERNEEAIEAIQEGLRLAGHLPEMQAIAGHAYLLLQQPQRALAPLTTALGQRPRDPGILTSLGVARHQLGETTEAIRLFRAALASRPDHATAAENLVDALDGKARLAIPSAP